MYSSCHQSMLTSAANECRRSEKVDDKVSLLLNRNNLILQSRWPAPTMPRLPNVVGYCTGMALHTYNRLHVSFFSFHGAEAEVAHDTAPDEYASSGSPSSPGVTLNAASIPTIFDQMFARARKRPGHCREPNPNARFGKAGASGESQRSGRNRSGSANTSGSCIIPL